MKRSLLILLWGMLWVSMGTMPTAAQTFHLSEPIDVAQDVEHRLVGAFEDTLLLFRRTRTRLVVQPLDTALRWGEERELSSDYTAFPRPIHLFTDRRYFYMVYSFVQKGHYHLRLQTMNSQAQVLEDHEMTWFDHAGTSRYFEPFVSEDKKTIVLCNVTFEGKMEVVNYDIEQHKLRWRLFFNNEATNYYKEFVQLFINNAGDVFFVFEKNNLRRRKTDHHFLIYRFDSTAQMRQYQLDFPAELSYASRFVYDELNQQVVGVGLYAGNTMYEAKGIYYLKTNLTEPTTITTSPFDEPFMRSLTGEKRRSVNGINNFYIEQLILRRDGGVILVAEQQLKYEYQSTSLFFQNENDFQQADYLYENILVASVHPTGAIHWKNVLYKNQNSENDQGRYSSFFFFKTVSSLRLIYNDAVRWDAPMFEYVIDGLGKMKRQILPRFSEERVLPEFRYALQLSSQELIALSQRNNKLRVVKLRYAQ